MDEQNESTALEIPRWYIPSLYGDVRLEVDRTGMSADGGPEATILYAQSLSPTEELAMEALRRRALAEPTRVGPLRIGRVPWASAEDFRPIADKSYRETEVRVRLRAPIAAVQKVLAKAMKPGRRVVSAVRFTDGRIEEVFVAQTTVAGVTTTTTALALPAASKGAKKDALAKVAKVEAAVSVAAPTIGCPAPDFGKSEVRARRVLLAFLDERQRTDLVATGRFVTRGQDTGRRYLLSLRDGPEGLLRTGGRGVYDLDAAEATTRRGWTSSTRIGGGVLCGGPLCVHDWTVPPSEEALAIHLMLSLPGRERLMRALPEVVGR